MHAAWGGATLIMVPACAAWVRLLVTALLCVAGVARPIGTRSDGAVAVRGDEPMHVSSPSREGELSRLRKRAGNAWGGDPVAFVDDGEDSAPRTAMIVDLAAPKLAGPVAASLGRARARGPPRA